MIPLDAALGEKASHVDLWRVLVYWTGAAVALLFAHWLFAAALHAAIHPFFDNLARLVYPGRLLGLLIHRLGARQVWG